METNLGNAIIGIISVIICIGPFIGIYLARVSKQNNILKTVQQHISHLNCKIGTHEFCGDFLIGLDENKRYVLFYKQQINEEPKITTIDLATVFSIKVLKDSKNLQQNKEGSVFIERIRLCLTSANKKETTLEFFNDAINMQLNGELQCAEKWSQIINDLI